MKQLRPEREDYNSLDGIEYPTMQSELKLQQNY
jgi:hypothetical protein